MSIPPDVARETLAERVATRLNNLATFCDGTALDNGTVCFEEWPTDAERWCECCVFQRASTLLSPASSPVPSSADCAACATEQEDTPHSGDDDLLDALTSARSGIDDALDALDANDKDQVKELLDSALEDLSEADRLRVNQLQASSPVPSSEALAALLKEMDDVIEAVGATGNYNFTPAGIACVTLWRDKLAALASLQEPAK